MYTNVQQQFTPPVAVRPGRSMRAAQIAVLLSALITSGLIAGLFSAFAYAVMPGLRRSGDSAFVEAMQRINEAILNPLFMSIFMGGLLLAGTAVFLHWRTGVRWWVVAGCAAYLLMFIITSAVNVPLNDQLAAAGDPARIADLAAVREQFESTWATWNAVRAVASTAGFVAFAVALLRYGAA